MSGVETFSNIHRRQLFYWLGYHIEYPSSSGSVRKLKDPQRQQYVDALKGAIEDGLWVKTPRVPDWIGDKESGEIIEVNRPIACFTEWLVGESAPHTTRYGRMGLGFSRKFVLDRGGHPVTYVKGALRGDPYTKNLIHLQEFLRRKELEEIFTEVERESLLKRLDYLAHFAKRLRPAPESVRRRVSPSRVSPSVAKKSVKRRPTFTRSYGKRLEYLEEREWRIVFHSVFGKYYKKSAGKPGTPDYYLPFQPGKELFTLALPDNKTVNMVMNNPFFTKKLYPSDAPHVTVLSLEDIGTF